MGDIKRIGIIWKDEIRPEKLPLGGKEPYVPKVPEVEKIELSRNIKKFDRKIEKHRERSPFDHNSVSLKKKDDTPVNLSPSSALLNPTYNTVGKFLGIDTLHDWEKYSDKVQYIVRWAHEKGGIKDGETEKLVHWISGASNIAPSFGMNHKKVDQLYLYAKLQMNK